MQVKSEIRSKTPQYRIKRSHHFSPNCETKINSDQTTLENVTTKLTMNSDKNSNWFVKRRSSLKSPLNKFLFLRNNE